MYRNQYKSYILSAKTACPERPVKNSSQVKTQVFTSTLKLILHTLCLLTIIFFKTKVFCFSITERLDHIGYNVLVTQEVPIHGLHMCVSMCTHTAKGAFSTSPGITALRKGSHQTFLLSQALDFHEPWPILVSLRDPQ